MMIMTLGDGNCDPFSWPDATEQTACFERAALKEHEWLMAASQDVWETANGKCTEERRKLGASSDVKQKSSSSCRMAFL